MLALATVLAGTPQNGGGGRAGLASALKIGYHVLPGPWQEGVHAVQRQWLHERQHGAVCVCPFAHTGGAIRSSQGEGGCWAADLTCSPAPARL